MLSGSSQTTSRSLLGRATPYARLPKRLTSYFTGRGCRCPYQSNVRATAHSFLMSASTAFTEGCCFLTRRSRKKW
eukprot:3194608-Alexandrium_andersonii.AAC.1